MGAAGCLINQKKQLYLKPSSTNAAISLIALLNCKSQSEPFANHLQVENSYPIIVNSSCQSLN